MVVLFLISWENVSMFLLEDKKNIKFRGVVQCELYMHFLVCFSCIYITEMLNSHPIHQYYTNPPFCNVLQIMKEKSSKRKAK